MSRKTYVSNFNIGYIIPRTETILRVFIASPDDVKEEREILEDVIRDLNTINCKSIGIRLDPIKWETNTYPSIDRDVQAGINDQIGDYDVFIGIMWKRFGTPTPRASSGTSEEFEIAYRRYLNDRENLKILFYFKDAPVSIMEIDPQQLIMIKSFREHLNKIGVSYRSFKGRDEFEKLIRINLGLLVQDWWNKLIKQES